MNELFLQNLKSISHDFLNRIFDGNRDRTEVLQNLNDFFSQIYRNGIIDRICKVSVTAGEPQFKQPTSSYNLRSGIELKILNSANFTEVELIDISQLFLGNPIIVRTLITLGFDTLVISVSHSQDKVKLPLVEFTNIRAIQNQPNHPPKPLPLPKNTEKQKDKIFNGDIYGKV